ncbi:MAG: hypothetical protein SAK29_12160 [Scytonema sp. PMC 1069.18]|nr:hypothetical protein [Scytonema sp. PMC 1069.18]MEC4886847.1 hypothetical protein [Scytonema sp. PMC 1070.18]
MLQIHLESEYNHFIHGKFATERDSGYRLVARSADLKDEEHLKRMAEKTYRFWGSKAPEKNTKAVGIFLEEGNKNLVLVKVETAVDERGQEVTSGYRGFNQLHYIFIPMDLVARHLRGRTFQLLSWMHTQRIPLFSHFDANLPSLPIPTLKEPLPTELNQEEVNKIKRCLNDTNTEGQPLLLLALAALSNDKRLLLTGENSVDFVESILLLLPASVRSKVSIAGGTLDEEHCDWAKLLIKANSSSQGQLVDKLIRLNYSTRKFEGQFDKETTFKSDYVSLLQSILNIPDIDAIPLLLKQLDSIDDNNVTLENLAAANIIVRLIEEFPQIFQQVWKSLSVQQIQFLKELQQNLHLAEKLLLEEKLLAQPRHEAENTAILRELITLCKKVVAYKSQQDWQIAWQLATRLATNIIFQDDITAYFELLDTALSGEVKVEDLYNSFNYKFAPLVVHFEAVKIHESNLCKQLQTKQPEVAKLINTLLTQQKTALKALPQLAKLTGMKDPEQDKFYEAALVQWSPFYEDARELLAALIQQSQEMGSYFNRNALEKTSKWFESKKPELSSIFIALSQSSTSWDTWNQLAKALYENQQCCATFLDEIVGTIFPTQVLETWLPVIAEDDDIRRTFCQNSSAWQQLRSHPECFEQLVKAQPEYATTLSRCLRDSNLLNWLNGKLLHYLCIDWIKQKRIDDDLKILVTDPNVTQTFTTQDWLELQYVCWTPGIELDMPSSRPILEVNEKVDLVNQAIKLINNLYTQPAQTRRLLQDCTFWQLELTQFKDILKGVTNQARDFDLVLEYISSDLAAISPYQDIPLLFAQLNRLSPASLRQLLNERLKQNFPLAEILLDHGLHEQTCLLEDATLISELYTLCKSVVKYKSRQNWQPAWQFATRLATQKIFQDNIVETFALLDTVLANDIQIEHLYNLFNCKFAPLVVHFEAVKIHESKLYKQLQSKQPEVAKLADTLLTQRNSALKHLPLLAKLTGMKGPEQDKFYQEILVTWLPSYEEARELLAALIQQCHLSGSHFNCNALNKTCAWFESKKPELSDIFIAIQQSPISWDTWHQLAKALYENQQRSAAFLDKIVGTTFPTQVLETWLPVIAENDDDRRTFCRNSSAWQQLRSHPECFEQLVKTRPEYVTTLTRCLRDSNCLGWLNSNLLYYLCAVWIKQQRIDDDLKILVTNPNVTQTFTTQDWLKLQYVCWTPGIELDMPSSRPILEVNEKVDLVNQAIKLINNLYTQPAQTRRLLQDCQAWRLDLIQLKDILKSVTNQAACDFDLVLAYISTNLTAIDLDRDISLLFAQLSQLSSASLCQVFNERLRQNLPLAEILLHHGLHEQTSFLKDTEVALELRQLCKSVVKYKSQQNWFEAWELVKKLDRSPIFKDDKERLDLLDAVRPTLTIQEKNPIWEYAITISEIIHSARTNETLA